MKTSEYANPIGHALYTFLAGSVNDARLSRRGLFSALFCLPLFLGLASENSHASSQASCVSNDLMAYVEGRIPTAATDRWQRIRNALTEQPNAMPLSEAKSILANRRANGYGLEHMDEVVAAIECLAQPEPEPEPEPGAGAGIESDDVPEACVSPQLLADVKSYSEETWRESSTHVERWLRVLQTFSGTANDSTVMTPAEAQSYADNGWPRWPPVVAALQCLETKALNTQVEVEDETDPQPLNAEPQQSSAPTGYEVWVTQSHDQDYAARFRYDVPEGIYETYDVTVHVQLTPADAAVDGVVVYLHAPAINNLLASGAIIGAGTANTHIPASSTAWTHRGDGHYTRVIPVTFNSVDDNVVNSNYGLGNFEIHTIPRDRQTKRGASGSLVAFYHQEDDLTNPTIANVTYTSTTAGTYSVMAGRQATAKLRVVVTPSGSASVTPRGELWTDIPANTSHSTEINQQHNGDSLYFSCPGPGDGWLTLAPHWNTPAHIDPNYSHTVKVCPGRPVSGSKRSDYLTYKFDAGLNCKEIDRLNSSSSAGIFGWVDVLDDPDEVCHANYEHVWELLSTQSFQMACTVMSGEGLPHDGLMAATVNGELLLPEDHLLRSQYKSGCYNY